MAVPSSQSTTRSQNAARRARPLPFLSGERGLTSASSPRRVGNVGSGAIVPAPEEDWERGPGAAGNTDPQAGKWRRGSRSQAPHSRAGQDQKAGI